MAAAGALALGLASLWPQVSHAQRIADVASGVVQSQILTIEPDRLFSETVLGKRMMSEIEAAAAELAAENRGIEAELTQEESDLTDMRATLPPQEFRVLADAFDEKVQRLRREQDAKVRDYNSRSETARREFLVRVQPVLGRLMVEAGARVIMDERSVFASIDAIDITDLAITRIDAEIGEGATSEQ